MNNRSIENILVTGGAGFIGANFIRYLFSCGDFTGRVVNFDKLTYAGNLLNLTDIEKTHGGERYSFVRGDITDADAVARVFEEYELDTVVHFAAESHVDRSIHGPKAFVDTNITGTFVLLEAARAYWKDRSGTLFHHVSTDEVFGSLGASGHFTEETPYDPRSPYSASKASSDHLVRAYGHTFGLPITISNCTNNYGPYQFPEKLIPVVLTNILEEKPIPVYGNGSNIRDWLFVEDHCSAIYTILQRGRTGETYAVGGENEWENIRLVREICAIMDKKRPRATGSYQELITFVTDRPGHDKRYAIDCSKIRNELGWKQSVTFAEGLEKTIDWYLSHGEWMDAVRSGEYRAWMERNYSAR